MWQSIKKRYLVLVAVTLLALMFGIELSTALQESQTFDEAIHLAAGVSYWKTGDWRMNPEHPPLLKLWSAIPVLFTKATLPTNQPSWSGWDGWLFGENFLYRNAIPAQTLLLLGRIPVMLISLLLGWWIFRRASEMFGQPAGLLSLSLFALDPNIIAHSRYVTTDLAFSAAAFFTIHRLERFWQLPTSRNELLLGLSLVIAGLTKFSGLVLLPIVGCLLLVMKLHAPRHSGLRWKRIRVWLGLGLPIAFLLTWSVYGFDVRRPANDPRIGLLYQQRQELLDHPERQLTALEKFAVDVLGDRRQTIGQFLEKLSRWPVPGYGFFRGAIAVIGHSELGQETYLLGSYSQRGWWYYFPIAIIAKTPFPTLIAFLSISIILMFKIYNKLRMGHSWLNVFRLADRRWVLWTITPILFLGFSMLSHLNLGWRHIMPIYPFLFVVSGSLAQLRQFRHTVWATIIPVLIISNLAIVQYGAYPNELGYFSSIVGGTNNGPKILLDSNLDWGQDLPKLRKYVRQQSLSRLPFAYFGKGEVKLYVPEAVPLPTVEEVKKQGLPHGLVAISVGELLRRDALYKWLWEFQPTKTIGSSIFIYQFP